MHIKRARVTNPSRTTRDTASSTETSTTAPMAEAAVTNEEVAAGEDEEAVVAVEVVAVEAQGNLQRAKNLQQNRRSRLRQKNLTSNSMIGITKRITILLQGKTDGHTTERQSCGAFVQMPGGYAWRGGHGARVVLRGPVRVLFYGLRSSTANMRSGGSADYLHACMRAKSSGWHGCLAGCCRPRKLTELIVE
mmetsp:Transcript_7314/g.14315  ORF Transcript_7314/g.14315 Transcript_7314/m.14315 type:complete len:192 (+) Transcript_7314:588-1163(+)